MLAWALCLLGAPRAEARDAFELQLPQEDDHALNILSPTVLEMSRVNSKEPDPARVDSWDWVTDSGTFAPTNLASLKVLVNGQADTVTAVGFKRRPLYAPLQEWDLRVGNELVLELANSIPTNATVQVVNDGTIWLTNLQLPCRRAAY